MLEQLSLVFIWGIIADMFRIAGLLLVGLILSTVARCDTAPLQVCNNGQQKFSIVLAYAPNAGALAKDYWVVSGWYSAEPGRCVNIAPSSRFQIYSNSEEYNVHRNMYLGFVIRNAAGQLNWFRPDSRNATTPGIIITGDASSNFTRADHLAVCANPSEPFETEQDYLNPVACKQGWVSVPLALQFMPSIRDVESSNLYKLPVNPANTASFALDASAPAPSGSQPPAHPSSDSGNDLAAATMIVGALAALSSNDDSKHPSPANDSSRTDEQHPRDPRIWIAKYRTDLAPLMSPEHFAVVSSALDSMLTWLKTRETNLRYNAYKEVDSEFEYYHKLCRGDYLSDNNCKAGARLSWLKNDINNPW